MKKALCLGLSALLLFLCAGCGGSDAAQTAQTDTPDVSVAVPEASSGIDIDLTTLNSTMVYSEVYGMVSEPDDYIGKTVRAKGPFRVFHDEANDNYFFAVLISDATACCAQGLEFVLKGDHVYPDDYPDLDTEIIVTGRFNTYMDGSQQYSHLENATMQLA